MRKATRLYLELTEAIRENGGVRCEQAPDAFFLDDGDANGPYKTRLAKILCDQCPVKALCLEYALEAREEHGIWGGMSAYERRLIVRRHARIA